MKQRTIRRIILLIPLLAAWTASVSGASIPVALTFDVTTVDTSITTIVVGDRFTVNFVIDDSVTDTNGSTGAGNFAGLLTSFTITADSSNTGTWSPSGTYSSGDSNFVTNANGDNLTLQIRGNGYPDGGTGWAFLDVDLAFGWSPGISDNGSGETFATQLGDVFGIPPATLSSAEIRFISGASNIASVVLSQVDVPSVEATPVTVPATGPLSLLVLGVGMLLLGARRVVG
jgi:hypothetical protein